jgi:16S rRNA (guanine527-N7)-methyltransferase
MSSMEPTSAARAAARWAGYELGDDATELLAAYATWLEAEAIPAGGLGPREGPRIWSRHIADSLLFAAGWRSISPPTEVLDVGTGVGLPGIPLAVLWPDTEVTLLDRGGRRIRLLQRVVRLLGLENVHVFQGDAFDVADEWRGVVYRGSVTAPESVGLSARLLDIPGTAVLGLSRRAEPPERARDLIGIAEAMGLTAEVVGVPPAILDAPAWLLIMRAGEYLD